jgi:alpha-beta hydrolase superfamily lysophospholipase
MKPQHPSNIRRALFALLPVALLLPGCVTREMAARMIVKAPNQQYMPAPPPKLTEFWNYFNDGRKGSRFISIKVKTGPPDAELAVAELPPGDYHVRFISGIRTNWEEKKFLTMKFEMETNRNFTPLKEPATIVILHGYMMYKETMAPWASELAQAGYRVVLVDLRGHGKSTGDQVTYGKYETKDLIQMLDELKARGLCDEKVGVLGLSYGATLALQWAARDPRVQAVVAIAPYNHPEEAALRLAKEVKIPVSPKTLREALALAAQRLDLKWDDWSGEAAIRQLKEPVLLIGGGHDRIALPADIETLKKAAPSGTEVLMVPGVNHFVLGFLLHELADPVKAWFQQHLEPLPEIPTTVVMGKDEVKPKPN